MCEQQGKKECEPIRINFLKTPISILFLYATLQAFVANENLRYFECIGIKCFKLTE